MQAKERMVKMVRRIIEERKKKIMDNTNNNNNEEEEKGGGVNDVVDVLLRDKVDPHSSPTLTFEMMSQNIIEMMIPGEETLPTAMTMAFNFLTHSPLALSKLRVRTFTYLYICLLST